MSRRASGCGSSSRRCWPRSSRAWSAASIPLELGPPVGWPVQYRVSGPDLTQGARDRARAGAASSPPIRKPSHVNFDWIEPTREVRIRIDQDEARLLGLSSQALAERAQHRDLRQPRHAGARRHLSRRRRGARDRRAARVARRPCAPCRCRCRTAAPCRSSQFATFDYEQEYPLVWRRDRVPTLTVQADVAPGTLPETVVVGARAGRRGPGQEPAATLPHRRRRHGRGEREVAGLGHRRRAGDAAHHAHRPDVPAAELPAPVPRAQRRAARADRRRRGAAVCPASRSASSPSSASWR